MADRTVGRALSHLALAAVVPPLAACGVIFGGTTKTISVTAAPVPATVSTMSGTAEFTTPGSLRLERRNSHTIIARKDGYRDAEAQLQKRMRPGPLVLDLLLGFPFGIVIDAVTGGWYDLQPQSVTLALEQLDPEQEGPDVITVLVGFDKARAWSEPEPTTSTLVGRRVRVRAAGDEYIGDVGSISSQRLWIGEPGGSAYRSVDWAVVDELEVTTLRTRRTEGAVVGAILLGVGGAFLAQEWERCSRTFLGGGCRTNKNTWPLFAGAAVGGVLGAVAGRSFGASMQTEVWTPVVDFPGAAGGPAWGLALRYSWPR